MRLIDKTARNRAGASKSRQNRQAFAVEAFPKARAVTNVHKVDHGADISPSHLASKGAVTHYRLATKAAETCQNMAIPARNA